MKRMCNMQMHGCCCMMAMTMKGSVYIIKGNEQKKHNHYEEVSIPHSIDFRAAA